MTTSRVARAARLLSFVAIVACHAGQARTTAPLPLAPPSATAALPTPPRDATPSAMGSAPAEASGAPTNHFAPVGRYPGYFDARVVGEHVVLTGCRDVRVLDSDLTQGHSLTGLPLPTDGCIVPVGALGHTLILYARGMGLLGIDLQRGTVRWSVANLDIASTIRTTDWHGEGAKPPPPLLSASVALTKSTVVGRLAHGEFVGWDAETGSVLWSAPSENPAKDAVWFQDGTGGFYQWAADRTWVAKDAATGALRWRSASIKPGQDVLLRNGIAHCSGDRHMSINGCDDPLGRDTRCFTLLPLSDSSRLQENTGESCLKVVKRGELHFLGEELYQASFHPAADRLSPELSPPYVVTDSQSAFAMDVFGRLNAYSLTTGSLEWTYGIGASVPLMLDNPVPAQPRIEWLGGRELLSGTGFVLRDASVTPVVFLFRKGQEPMVDRTVTVRGELTSETPWKYDPTLTCGPFTLQVNKKSGRIGGVLHGRGLLRVSMLGLVTAQSDATPLTIDVDLDGAPSVDLRIHQTFTGGNEGGS
jgi:hypothetical protein